MRDMTTGSAHEHLWRYAVPILLGNWLQLAYNAIDSIIAGRFIGKDALAAEGIAGPVMNLVILAITGLCIGTGVLMSEFFGAKDLRRYRQSLGTTMSVGGGASVLMAGICIVLSPFILKLLAVPDEIFDITTVYLRIIFLGMPFTFFYNALAAGLKSAGDSKTPLKFLAFSSVLNAGLDLLFLGVLHFGIVCSAVTTVVAEAISALLAIGYLVKKFPELFPRREEWKADKALLEKILKYGAPSAFQQAVQPIGKVLIQGQVNALGVTTIAAFNAVTRVDDFACIPEQGISASISTFIAQNRGAKKEERIRPGFRAGLRLEIGYWILIGAITALFRMPIVSLFVLGKGAEEVIETGSQYLGLMAFFYLYPALTNGFQGFYRGMGKMYTTILGTAIQISIRTLATFLLAPQMGIVGIAYACAAGWTVMLLFEIPYYFKCVRTGLLKESQ
ncbi:MAG: MATE family efflux transporter [Acetatifactor sp.]|nr:MATE family efflux transporter [Acetatifactor sp.]